MGEEGMGEERFCRNPAVSVTAVEADLFLVEPMGQDVYYLNAIAGGIWQALEAPAMREEVLRLYAAAFPDEDPTLLAREVGATFDDMARLGLVISAPETLERKSETSDP